MTETLPPLASGDTVVIVGAGLAGLRTAEGLREAGFAGRVVLVGDEPHAPYDRPPLSKLVLTNEGHEHQIGLLPEADLEALTLDVKLGRTVVAIDRAARAVSLSDGEAIAYDRLVLATGSTIRVLPGLEPERPGVHYLRTLDDALALRTALASAKRIAVIGAGVIGLEVAASAAKPDRLVTVIEAGDRVMSRAASPTVSDFITRRHLDAGVDLRLGTTVSEVAANGSEVVLTLSGGETLACDLVAVGVGVTPNDGLARAAGLEVRPGGILVDGYGASSDPAIYVAGEVALHFNGLHGRHDRQETWAHAAAHGLHVGRSLVGPDDDYREMASYWTDQYDFSLNVIGEPMGEQDAVRGDLEAGQFLVFHLVGGKVVGVSGINAARDLRTAKRLIGNGRVVDPEVLANTAIDLKTLV
jgi:NADPH-dependent 2,4-dienoyl-CoA reductase/sulfur reductase-like enzyme